MAFSVAPTRPGQDRPDHDGAGHVLDAAEVRTLYHRIAPSYDLAAGAYALFGARRLGSRGVDLLDLRAGDTAVDLGCGTGVNLAGLAHAVGPTGRVIGVDISKGMLARARRQAVADDLTCVELVQADLREYPCLPTPAVSCRRSRWRWSRNTTT